MAKKLSIPLPRGWPRFVKRALLAAVGLERLALLDVRSGFENSPDPRAGQSSEVDRLRELLALRDEEIRILRARLEHVPPRKRPLYPAAERLAILELRSKYEWKLTETARRFQLTAKTIASWMHRLDEQGPDALVQTPVPVNRFPDFVTLLVQKLHRVAPGMGRRKVADLLARAGLHLAASTVERLRKKPPPPPPVPPPEPTHSDTKDATTQTPPRVVTAKHPHHLWHIDLTVVPAAGFWVPWWPFSLFVLWPVCWWVAVVLDHHSRAVVGAAVFRKEPTAAEVCSLLDNAVERAGRAPRHIVSDQGSQFQSEYRAWCKKNDVKPRFGAIGQHGSIAVIERFMRTMKDECFRKILVPLSLAPMVRELSLYVFWYNEHRPHASLAGATPAEVRDGRLPARSQPALEVRRDFPLPRGDPTPLRRRSSRPLELVVTYLEGRPHLPLIELGDAA
jgi:transposase InsO family protein